MPDNKVFLFTPEQVSSVGVEALRVRSTLARIVNTDVSAAFAPGVGASVTVKAPAVLDKAGTYTQALRAAGDTIKYGHFVQPSTSIKLERQVYQALELTDEVTTFDIADLTSQIIAPMVTSVADEINTHIVLALHSVPAGLSAVDTAAKDEYVTDAGNAVSSVAEAVAAGERIVGMGAAVTVKASQLKATTHADVRKTIRYAHTLLNQRGVPAADRYLVVGSGWAQALLADESLTKVSEAGEPDALRDAIIGRLTGFTIVEEPGLDPLAAYAMHRDAIALALVAPAIPSGAAFGTYIDGDGFRLRYIHDYDADHLQDRAVVSTFCGARVLDQQRIVRLEGTEGFEEPAAPAPAGE